MTKKCKLRLTSKKHVTGGVKRKRSNDANLSSIRKTSQAKDVRMGRGSQTDVESKDARINIDSNVNNFEKKIKRARLMPKATILKSGIGGIRLSDGTIVGGIDIIRLPLDETLYKICDSITDLKIGNDVEIDESYLDESVESPLDYLTANRRSNIDVQSVGVMNEVCRYCEAYYFLDEAIANGNYNKCCIGGRIHLEPYKMRSETFKDLYLGTSLYSKDFKRNILLYNNSFQFVSVNVNIRNDVMRTGGGPYVYAIQGRIYHEYSDINVNRDNQKYGPVYFLDPNEADQCRKKNAESFQQKLNATLLQLLRTELDSVNPYAKEYRHLREIYLQNKARASALNESSPEIFIEIVGRRRDTRDREHDLPEVEDVAVVYQTDDATFGPNPTMRVFLRNEDNGLRRIKQNSPLCDPLAFPLLFPEGDEGWSIDLSKQCTPCQWYGYHLAYRKNQFQAVHLAGKLAQQFIVAAYLKVEFSRINYIVTHQDEIRRAEYEGLTDYFHSYAKANELQPGKMIILPGTFPGSPRDQQQRFQDAMAVVAHLGNPSLFITFTCNPKWPEILTNIPQNDEPGNHPLIVNRVFLLKLKALMGEIKDGHIFGVPLAYLYVIEFQKRGLPHAHILITLRKKDEINSVDQVNRFVCAEIPDEQNEPELYELVGKHMIHGPCGKINPNEICLQEGKCTRRFPVKFCSETSLNENYIRYRRRRDGRTIEVRRRNRNYTVDNQFVVPYNPYLLLRYRTHINLMITRSTGCVKYLFKYFFKGSDQALLRIVERRSGESRGRMGIQSGLNGNDHTSSTSNVPIKTVDYDEVKSYFNGRYMTPPEAAWHILKFVLHKNSHVVYRLQIHLPTKRSLNVQRRYTTEIKMDANDEREKRQCNTQAEYRRSMLTEWFELNVRDPDARQYLYTEIPKHYVWKFVADNKSYWSPRKRFASRCIARMHNVSPKHRELFHMRVLLLYVRGARSYEELRTVGGDTVYRTFEEACRARNLLADDTEWFRCMKEAARKDMPSVLRRLFAYILVFCEVGNPQLLWNSFKKDLMEDFIKKRHMSPDEAERRTLLKIRAILSVHSLSVTQFGFTEPQEIDYDHDDIEETALAEKNLSKDSEVMVARLNLDQRTVFDRIMQTVERKNVDVSEDRLFHVRGAAGTGKTFLYNTILTVLEARDIKTIAVAWTGLAASLLKGGRTVHSQFQLPIPVVADSRCRVGEYSKEGARIKRAKLIVWDEISMTTAVAFDLVDRTLRQLCNENRPFGGKTVVVGGDFKQCLPVVEEGDRTLTLKACVKESTIWNEFVPLTLKQNMRVDPEEVPFLEWLERLGTGTLPAYKNRKGHVEIPTQCMTLSLDTLIGEIFFSDGNDFDPIAVTNNAILTPLNVSCNEINKVVLDKIPGEIVSYFSVDSVQKDKENDDEVEAINYPTEFLNKMTPSGYPPHCLELKVNATVLLLMNLNVQKGLCNGTRILLRELGEHHLDGETVGTDGRPTGVRVFIPKVDTARQINSLPHKLKRRQFPVRLAYAMTITKAQGQTLNKVGIYLPHPVFDHGQLYVAFSRAKRIRDVRVFLQNYGSDGKPLPRESCNHTKNIVFQEVFFDEKESVIVKGQHPEQAVSTESQCVVGKPNGEVINKEQKKINVISILSIRNGQIVDVLQGSGSKEQNSTQSRQQSFKVPEVPMVVSENPKRGFITGLQNPHPKVSCYANVVVQCMLQIPEFVEHIYENDTEFKRITGLIGNRRVQNCVQLRRQLGGIFAQNEQQDCQEFLYVIMNQLPIEFSRALFRFEMRHMHECVSCGARFGQDDIVESFYGDRMFSISLPINTTTTFGQLFQRVMDGTHFCNSCGIDIEKVPRFTELSKYLILILSRYTYDGRRNNTTFVDFDPDRCIIADRAFRTIGVIRHEGVSTITSGHYTCTIRDRHGRWIQCDDERISFVETFDVTLKNAYVLILQKIDF